MARLHTLEPSGREFGAELIVGKSDDEPLVISVISLGELRAGVELASDDARRTARLRRLTAILGAVPVLPVDSAVAARYGELRRVAGRGPTNDLWIAATPSLTT